MSAEVALGVVLDDDLPVLGLAQRDRPLERPDERMIGLDAAVEDADPNPGPGRAAERPVACNALRPFDSDPNLGRRGGWEAPGREGLAGIPLGLLLGLSHAAILNSGRVGDGPTQGRRPKGRGRTAVSDTGFCQGRVAPEV